MQLSLQDFLSLLESKPTIVDIRDIESFEEAHIENAIHLSNDNINQFVADTPKKQTIVVYCYHGISSQHAAAYLSKQGFEKVYSLDGGFEAWKLR